MTPGHVPWGWGAMREQCQLPWVHLQLQNSPGTSSPISHHLSGGIQCAGSSPSLSAHPPVLGSAPGCWNSSWRSPGCSLSAQSPLRSVARPSPVPCPRLGPWARVWMSPALQAWGHTDTFGISWVLGHSQDVELWHLPDKLQLIQGSGIVPLIAKLEWELFPILPWSSRDPEGGAGAPFPVKRMGWDRPPG